MSEQAHEANLASARFAYFVAESQGSVVGYIAMRDGTHLFNLFVHHGWLRRGVARALWHYARERVPGAASADITVNASLNAVPVYLALGFRQVGTEVRQHGIAFIPMLLHSAASNAA